MLERPWVLAELTAAHSSGQNISTVLVEWPSGSAGDRFREFRFPQDLDRAIHEWSWFLTHAGRVSNSGSTKVMVGRRTEPLKRKFRLKKPGERGESLARKTSSLDSLIIIIIIDNRLLLFLLRKCPRKTSRTKKTHRPPPPKERRPPAALLRDPGTPPVEKGRRRHRPAQLPRRGYRRT